MNTSPEHLEQLARSLAMDGSLGRHEALEVVEILDQLAREKRDQRRLDDG